MAVFMAVSKTYVAKIGDVPEISFEADGEVTFIELLRETINDQESLLDLDGRIIIEFTRPDKTTGRITVREARLPLILP